MDEFIVERSFYSTGGFVARVINGVFGLIGFMLIVRLVLELLDANPGASFIGWIYGLTDPLIAPFAGAFPGLSAGGYAAEVAVLVSLVGYAIIGWLVLKLLSFIFNSF